MFLSKKSFLYTVVFLFVLTSFVGADNSFVCVLDGVCSWPESRASCPSDCGSTNISSFEGQRAKFIDPSCQFNGDGLVDVCASSPGASGRFNDLQSAIDSLVAGDTLYVYPGDYWQLPVLNEEYVGIYTVSNSGSSQNPIIITAYDSDNPPVIHSFDPSGQSSVSIPALSTHGERSVHDVVFDNLRINGRIQLMGGSDNVIQNVECTHGWGACDGNWACLRVEGCTNCVANNNFVHDVDDFTGRCDGIFDPRPSGLKEFTSQYTIWEYNTVVNSSRWGYDHHRDSFDTVLRFNVFENTGSHGIRLGDDPDRFLVYGNVVDGVGTCVWTWSSHNFFELNNNICTNADWGFYLYDDEGVPAVFTVENNYLGSISQTNIAFDGVQSDSVDFNVYDSDARYSVQPYAGPHYYDLSSWTSASGFDVNSQEASCVVSNNYSLSGVCSSASSSGGMIGPLGIADCVGYLCSEENTSTSSSSPSSPVVSSVSDSVFVHGSQVSVFGSGFGVKDPAPPRVWDPMDSSSPDDPSVFYGDIYPKVCTDVPGEDPYLMDYRSEFHGFSDFPNPRVSKFLSAAATTCDGSWYSWMADNLVTIMNWNSDKVFLMYYYRMSPTWSLENSPYGDNLKEVSFNGGSGTYLEGADTYIDWVNGATPMIAYPDDPEMRGTPDNIMIPNPMNGWVHFEVLANGTQGAFFDYSNGVSSSFRHFYYDWGGDGILHADGNPPAGISIGGFTRWPRYSDTGNYRFWASIYADDTFSRVILANTPNYSLSTIREPQIPVSWSDSAITFTVNQGSFSDGDTAYLFVFDANNNHNPVGFPVTFSSSNPPVCGDGVVETGEDCDDGNTITESCSYGLTSCQVCDSSCQLVSGSTSFCGDSFCDNSFEDSNSCPQDCSTGSLFGNSCSDAQKPGVFFCEGWESGSANTFLSSWYGNFLDDPAYSVSNLNPATGSFSARVHYTQGNTMGYVTQHFADSTKVPVWDNLSGVTLEDIYIQYKIYYSPGFDFSAGNNKQVIIGTDDGTRHDETCCNPWVAHYVTLYAGGSGNNGFFAAEANNKAPSNQWLGIDPNVGGYDNNNRFYITSGRWYTVEVRIRLNDPGQSNGVFQEWVDGVLVANYTNLLLRVPFDGVYGTDFNYGVNFLMLSNYIDNPAPQDQDIFYDDVKISTSYIGSGLSQGGFCGDSVCDASESCSSCPSDCGSCPFNPDINSDSNVSFIDLLLFGRDFGSVYNYNDFNILVTTYS